MSPASGDAPDAEGRTSFDKDLYQLLGRQVYASRLDWGALNGMELTPGHCPGKRSMYG